MLRRTMNVAVLLLAGSVSSSALGAVGEVYVTRNDLVAKFVAPLSGAINSSPFTGWNYTDVALNQSSGKAYISSSAGGTNQVAMFDSTTLAHQGSTVPYIGWDFQALAVNQSADTLYAMGANQLAAFDGTTLAPGATSPFFTGWSFKDIAVNQTTGDIYIASWDGTTGQIARFDSSLNHLGSMFPHTGWDFTSIDINQSTGELYAASGGNAGFSQIARIDGTTLANTNYSVAYPGWGFKGISVNQTTGDVYVAGEDTGGGYAQAAEFSATLAPGPTSPAYVGWDFQGIDVDDTTGDVFLASSNGQIASFNASLGALNTSFSYGSLTGDIVVQQVPEPASLALLGLGGALLLVPRSRG